MMGNTYYKEIDILKGIAISLVILGHAIILYPINLLQVGWCKVLYDLIYFVHMPLFFVVSGFCFQVKEDETISSFLSRKGKRLVVPYMVFGFIDLVPRALFTDLVNRDALPMQSVIDMLLYGGQYWFLYTLFVIMALMYIVEKVICKYPAMLYIIAAVLVVFHFYNKMPEQFMLYSAFHDFVFFFLGYMVKGLSRDGLLDAMAAILRNNLYLAGCLVCGGILFGLWEYGIRNEFLSFAITIVGIMILAALAAQSVNIYFGTVMAACGRYSLQLYLLNGFLLVISRAFIIQICGIGMPVVIILFNVFVDEVVSYYVIDKIIAQVSLFRFAAGMPAK